MKDNEIKDKLKEIKEQMEQKEAYNAEEEQPKEPKYVQMSLEDFGIVIE